MSCKGRGDVQAFRITGKPATLHKHDISESEDHECSQLSRLSHSSVGSGSEVWGNDEVKLDIAKTSADDKIKR